MPDRASQSRPARMGIGELVHLGERRDDRVRADDGGGTLSSRRFLLLEVSVIITVGIVAFTVLFSVVYAQKLDSTRRAEQIAGCERANQQRRYINEIIKHHPDFSLPPIEIPDCSEIIR